MAAPLVEPTGVPSGSVTVTAPLAVKVTVSDRSAAGRALPAAGNSSSVATAPATSAQRTRRAWRVPVADGPELTALDAPISRTEGTTRLRQRDTACQELGGLSQSADVSARRPVATEHRSPAKNPCSETSCLRHVSGTESSPTTPVDAAVTVG